MARVLFLDDEGDLVDYLPYLLKEQSFEVISTTSISEALAKLAEESFDVVLLDIMMPPAKGMEGEHLDYGRETGIEVARKMKAIKPDVPIIAFTVLTDPEILARTREAGVVKTLNKPAEPDQIVYVLRQVVTASE
jgi:CheY-like chemotaxis protein